MSKRPPRKHYVPVDGTAVNPGWTIENARYAALLGRYAIARKQRAEKEKEIQESGRETVHIPATF